jgi:hypothetical protein
MLLTLSRARRATAHSALAGALLINVVSHASGEPLHAHDSQDDGPNSAVQKTQDSSTPPRDPDDRAHHHEGHASHSSMPMFSVFGAYPLSRDASGTSWQPDSTPHDASHLMIDDWMLMGHARLFAVYDRQSGPRGGGKTFAAGMIMGMAQRPIGEDGALGLRAMVSPDPFMGAKGYPLLFAVGETADGVTNLVDRQHPHDLVGELSAAYGHRFSPTQSAFLYAGLPGEPALGPPTFMHRISGQDIPAAPISHHWLDSTHVSFGVVTAGFIWDAVKIEASAFRGREPDQHRFDIEKPWLDSFSGRLSWNPTSDLALQASWGHIKSPEQLMPNVDENRFTLSAIYNKAFEDANWATTFAWGRKMNRPGNRLNGFLLESAYTLSKKHTFFARAERVDEDELFEHEEALPAPIVTVNKFTLGYVYDIEIGDHLKLGVGALISKDIAPRPYNHAYGGSPTSFMTFLRFKTQ